MKCSYVELKKKLKQSVNVTINQIYIFKFVYTNIDAIVQQLKYGYIYRYQRMN